MSRKPSAGVTRHKRTDVRTPAQRQEAIRKAVEQAAAGAARPWLTQDLLDRSRQRGRPGIDFARQTEPFKPYQPLPGVLPKGKKVPTIAMDDGIVAAQGEFSASWGFNNPWASAFQEGIGFLGYAYLAELTQRPEYRRMSERIATEMTRKWVRLVTVGEADKGSDGKPDQKKKKSLDVKMQEIAEDMATFRVRDVFYAMEEQDGFFGRSHIYVDTGDTDNLDELVTSIGTGSDETSIAKGLKNKIKAFRNVEPIWCYPAFYNANDPLKADWYNPQQWYVLGKQLHVSRLITYVGREVPDILKPAYAFGGLSLSQMAKPYIDNWLRTRQAVADLIESFSVSGIYTNMAATNQVGGLDVLGRIDLFNNTRSNRGAMALDKETEEFFNVSTPLGSLDHLQAQAQEQMSSVSGIPLIILLGITPTGLNASSEGELRAFYDLIHAMQEKKFRPKLKIVLDFLQLNRYGKVDPAIGFEFEPLWSLDEKGEAEVEKIKAETLMVYSDGIVSTEEIRHAVVQNPNLPFNGLDPDDVPDIEEEQDDQGFMPGAPGGKGPEGGSSRADNREVSGAADEDPFEWHGAQDDGPQFEDHED